MAVSSELDHRRKPDRTETNLWQPLIVECIASFLPPNVVACTLRLVNKATHDQFRTCSRVDLGLPCPEHAFAARFGDDRALRSLSFKQRRKFLIRTAASGSIPNLKVAFRAIAATLTDEELDPDALAPGQMCPWLEGKGCWWLDWVLAGAAGAGQREMCEWLWECGCPCSIAAVYSAVRGGHVGLMDWLLHQRSDLRAEVKLPALIEAAAEGGDLAALKQLYGEWSQGQDGQQQLPVETTPPPRISLLATVAAASGSSSDWRAKVEWLEGLGSFSKSEPAAYRAVLFLPDAVERLAWLRGRGYVFKGLAIVAAVAAGNATAVEYLLDEARPSEYEPKVMCNLAAGQGHLPVLQTLHTRGCLNPGPDRVSRRILLSGLDAAVSHGHVAVATWLVDTFGLTGAELQEVLDDDAVPGSIQMAEWLQSRGCHWHIWPFVTRAAEDGCEELLEFAVAGLELQPHEPAHWAVYASAVRQRDIATLHCLHRLGVPMTEGHRVYDVLSIGYPICTRDLPALRCLHSQLRYPWSPTKETFNHWAFIRRRPLAVLRWLVEEASCPVDWKAAVRNAKREHLVEDVRQWLQSQSAPAAPGRRTAGG